MEKYFEDLRANLKYYRKERDVSQARLAELCDCSNGMIGLIESGKAKPSLDLIIKMADALSINPADLFLRDASMSREEFRFFLEKTFSSAIKSILKEKF